MEAGPLKVHAWRALILVTLLVPVAPPVGEVPLTSEVHATSMGFVDAVSGLVPEIPRHVVEEMLRGLPDHLSVQGAAAAVERGWSYRTANPGPVSTPSDAVSEPEHVAATWDFDNPDDDQGWSHGGVQDDWARGLPLSGPALPSYELAEHARPEWWIEASQGGVQSNVTENDGWGRLVLPFPFRFMGVPVDALHYGTNGLITFPPNPGNPAALSSGAHAALNRCIGDPGGGAVNAFIAPLWDDLQIWPPLLPSPLPPLLPPGPTDGRIWIRFGTTEDLVPYAVIQWSNMRLQPGNLNPTPFTFQAVLFANDTIRLQYKTAIPTKVDATIGVEDITGTNGLELACGQSVRVEPGVAYDLHHRGDRPGSGQKLFATDLVTNYKGNAKSWLKSPPLNLSGTDNATLSFWHWHRFEPTADGGLVQVSADAGATWQTLTPAGGYPAACSAFTGQATPCFGGFSGWRRTVIDLTPYVESQVQVRFQFASTNNFHYAGWYIDDVELRTNPPSARDVKIARIVADSDVVLDEPQNARVEIRNRGSESVEGVRLHWLVRVENVNVSQPQPVDLGPLAPGANVTRTFSWTPQRTRLHTLSARVEMLDANGTALVDDRPSNDARSALVDVLQIKHGTGFETDPVWAPSANATDQWQWGTPTSGPGPDEHGKVWATKLAGLYEQGTRSELVSPAIEMPYGFENPEFSFQLWLQSQAGVAWGRVEIQRNNGTWGTLIPRPETVPYDIGGACAGDPNVGCWSSGSAAAQKWRRVGFDLTPFLGDVIRLRFLFVAADQPNGNNAGMYIDDVLLSGRAAQRDIAVSAIERPVGLVGPNETVPTVVQFLNSGRDPLQEVQAEIGFQEYSTDEGETWVPLGPLTPVDLGDLDPNEFVERTVDLRVPDAEGAFVTLVVRTLLDDDHQPANDVRTVVLYAQSVYDVRLEDAFDAFYEAEAGTPVRLAARLVNSGTRTTSVSPTVTATATNGSTAADFGWNIQIPPSDEAVLEHVWLPPAPGRYEVRFEAPLMEDARASDNVLHRSFFYAVPPRLFVEDFEAGGVGWTPSSAAAHFPPDWQRGTPTVVGPGTARYVARTAANEWIEASQDPDAVRLNFDAEDENDLDDNPDDESTAIFPLPATLFLSHYADRVSTHLGISTNGFFTSMNSPTGNAPPAGRDNSCEVPSATADPDGFVAPFWDDLVVPEETVKTLGSPGVYVLAKGDTVVVEWKDVHLKSGSSAFTFEVVLRKSTEEIRFQYLNAPPTSATATTAIERMDGLAGVLLACNSASAYQAGSGWVLEMDRSVPAANSPPYAWGTHLSGLHGHGRRQVLATGALNLTGATELRFWHYHDTEMGRDGGRIVYSVAGGPWTALEPEGGYPSMVAALNAGGWSGDSQDWVEVHAPLAAVAGPDVRLGFEFASDAQTAAAGWYVDGMAVLAGESVLAADEFDDALGLPGLLAPVHDIDWAFGEPDAPTVSTPSSGAAATTNLTGTYRAGIRQFLDSPPMNASASLQPQLSFFWHVDTECPVPAACSADTSCNLEEECSADLAFVYLRRDSDSPWLRLVGPVGGRLGWRYEQFNLSADLIGPAMQLRFELRSNSKTLPQFSGLTIDDVSLSDLRPAWGPRPPPIPAVDESTLTATLEVRNEGRYPDAYQITGHHATDPNWTVEADPPVVALEPGEKASIEVTVRTGPGGKKGLQDVSIHATSLGDPFRRATLILRVNLDPRPRPDLRVAAIEVEGAELRDGTPQANEGEAYTVRVDLFNAGPGVGEDFPLYLYDLAPDGTELLLDPVPACRSPKNRCAAGGTGTVDFVWVAEGGGPHRLRAVIDPEATRRETDRTNNEGDLGVSVVSIPRPDLRVEAIRVEPSTPRVGEASEVQLRVVNGGDVPTGSSVAYELLLDAPAGTLTTPELPAGEGPHTLEARVHYDLESGVDAVVVEALGADGWSRVLLPPGQSARIPTADGPVLAGSTGGEWRTLALTFEDEPPTQLRFVAKLDASNTKPAQGWFVDALRWTDADGGLLWGEDFESTPPTTSMTGFIHTETAPRAPGGFLLETGSAQPGGLRAAGFGSIAEGEGYDRLFSDPDCASACLVGAASTTSIQPGETREIVVRWVPTQAGNHTLLARLDAKGRIREGTGQEENVLSQAVLVRSTGLRLEGPAGAVEVAAGSSIVVPFVLANDGDEPVAARLAFVSPGGWQAAEANGTAAVELAPRGRATLDLRLHVPSSAAGEYELGIRSHEADRASNAAEFTLRVNALPSGNGRPWTLAAGAIGEVLDGEGTATFRVRSGPGVEPRILFGVSERPTSWLAHVEPAEVSLGANETREILVRIRAPATEPPGLAEIRLWGEAGGLRSNLSLSVRVLPTVHVELELPKTARVSNGTASAPILVRNTGTGEGRLSLRMLVDGAEAAWPADQGNVSLAAGASEVVAAAIPWERRDEVRLRIEARAGGRTVAFAEGSVALELGPAATPQINVTYEGRRLVLHVRNPGDVPLVGFELRAEAADGRVLHVARLAELGPGENATLRPTVFEVPARIVVSDASAQIAAELPVEYVDARPLSGGSAASIGWFAPVLAVAAVLGSIARSFRSRKENP